METAEAQELKERMQRLEDLLLRLDPSAARGTTALERVSARELARQHPEQYQRRPPPTIDWTPEERKIIRDQCAKNATDEDFRALMAIAKARGLDPLKKQIYFRKQKEYDYDAGDYVYKWITITSIDGLRVIADRTGLYDGQEAAAFEYSKGTPCASCGRGSDELIAARVIVYRKDMSRGIPGLAMYNEFVQMTNQGKPNRMWEKMEHNQLAKCAEAAALRRAFPDDCGSMYLPEEFPDIIDVGSAPAPAERMSSTSAPPPPAQTSPPVTPSTAAAGTSSSTTPTPTTATAAPVVPPALTGQAKVDHWVGRFEKAGSVKAMDQLGQEANAESFTGAERKQVVKAFTTWRKHYEDADKKSAAGAAEPASSGQT